MRARFLLVALAVVLGLLLASREQQVSAGTFLSSVTPPLPKSVAAVLPADLRGNALLAAIVVDIDRDGDHDIIALKLRKAAVILINEGHGRFSRHSSRGASRLRTGRRWGHPLGVLGVLGVSGTTSLALFRGGFSIAAPDVPAAWKPLSDGPWLRLQVGGSLAFRGPPRSSLLG